MTTASSNSTRTPTHHLLYSTETTVLAAMIEIDSSLNVISGLLLQLVVYRGYVHGGFVDERWNTSWITCPDTEVIQRLSESESRIGDTVLGRVI